MNNDPTTIGDIDVSKLSSTEIEDLMVRLHENRAERLIEGLMPLRGEFQDLTIRINEAVEPYGLTYQKYLSMTRAQLKRHLLTIMQHQAAAKLPGGMSRKPIKVAPKYRNPQDASQTWTGRGNKPHWVRDWLEAGNSLADITIKKES